MQLRNGTRLCRRCRQKLSYDHFDPAPPQGNKRGFQRRCKTCQATPFKRPPAPFKNDRPPIQNPNDPSGKTWLVPLTRGLFATIDAEDVAVVAGYKWHATASKSRFYAVSHRRDESGKVVYIRMHRLLMNAPDDLMVDHKDRDGLNNRRDNLRLDDGTGNARNVGLRSDNTSGFKGVSFRSREQKWGASIARSGKVKMIGQYETPEEAAHAYDEKAREYFGEFAYLNYPDELAS